LRSGDTLIVTRIDRLARSIKDLQDIVYELKARGVALKATEQPIDTRSAAGKAFLDMLGVFAEFETNLRRERQAAGAAEALDAADVSVELDVSAGFEQPAIIIPPIAAAATSVKNLDWINAPFVSLARDTSEFGCSHRIARAQGDAASDEKQPDVSRISIRFAKPYNAARFVTFGVVSGRRELRMTA
jgi:hypothetical protein